MMYANKADIGRIFRISQPTVRAMCKGIEEQIGSRYEKYVVLDNLYSVEAFADYYKYRKILKYAPPFDLMVAGTYLVDSDGYIPMGRIRPKTKI